jgi:tRNA 2-thiocytidine biosynthesis protein TtcA
MPAVTHSRKHDFRLIRPLVFVTEDITRAYAEHMGVPVVPCGCSQRTGTVRRSIRDMFGEMEREHPHLKENLLSAMGNLDPSRLLDPRFLNLDEAEETAPELFPLVAE